MLKLTANRAHRELVSAFPRAFSLTRGTPVTRRAASGPGFTIERKSGGFAVTHSSTSEWFRALGELLRNPELESLEVTPCFATRGLVIDASRNGVPHVASLEQRIVELALLGINQLALYTEDTYQVEGHPLVGYLRGPYTRAELSRLARFAAQFGIEMFPCIQTLAHLEQVLQYRKRYSPIRDTNSVLLVNAPQTRDFVAALLDSASAPYASPKIHIGMDEPWDLGRGVAFRVGQKNDPRELYLRHLSRVAALCAERNLEPIAWGDFVLGQHAFNGDIPMTRAQWRRIPKNITLNYWHYFSEDEGEYRAGLERFAEHGFEPIVSPALWNWDRFWGIADKAQRTFIPLLRAARAQGLERVLMTLWGDDGQEAPYRSNFPALCQYAEHCFRARPRDAEVASMVQALTGDTLVSFLRPTDLDCPDALALQKNGNLAKVLTWDDPLLGLFASHLGGRRLSAHYETVGADLRAQAKAAASKNKTLFRFAAELGTFLEHKADLHQRARAAYLAGNRKALGESTRQASVTIRAAQKLWRAHRRIWLEENKPFGLEVLDLRYGGQIARLQVFRETLEAHLADGTRAIPEFDAKRENYLGDYPHHGRKYRGTSSPVFSIWI